MLSFRKMASSEPSPGLIDRMSCSICMEQYNNESHVPKLLPCQHTFCLSCLTSMDKASIVETRITCPVCRSKHSIPRRGFTTNRAVLDIVEELQKENSAQRPGLKCTKHGKKECMLVCIDCVEGLCAKCMKRSQHQGHHLEELSEASIILQQQLEEKTKAHRSLLEHHISVISKLPCSVSETAKAETDIRHLGEKLIAEIISWRDEHLSMLGDMKEEIANQGKKLKAELDLLGYRNDSLATLITKLKSPTTKYDPELFVETETKKYKSKGGRQALQDRIQQVINSKKSTSKIVNQEKIMGQQLTSDISSQVCLDPKERKPPHVKEIGRRRRKTVVDSQERDDSALSAQQHTITGRMYASFPCLVQFSAKMLGIYVTTFIVFMLYSISVLNEPAFERDKLPFYEASWLIVFAAIPQIITHKIAFPDESNSRLMSALKGSCKFCCINFCVTLYIYGHIYDGIYNVEKVKHDIVNDMVISLSEHFVCIKQGTINFSLLILFLSYLLKFLPFFHTTSYPLAGIKTWAENLLSPALCRKLFKR